MSTSNPATSENQLPVSSDSSNRINVALGEDGGDGSVQERRLGARSTSVSPSSTSARTESIWAQDLNDTNGGKRLPESAKEERVDIAPPSSSDSSDGRNVLLVGWDGPEDPENPKKYVFQVHLIIYHVPMRLFSPTLVGCTEENGLRLSSFRRSLLSAQFHPP